MNSANIKILRGEVRSTSDLSDNNPIAYNGHRNKFKTMPHAKMCKLGIMPIRNTNGILVRLSSLGSIGIGTWPSSWSNPSKAPPPVLSRQGTLQEALSYWKGQKRKCGGFRKKFRARANLASFWKAMIIAIIEKSNRFKGEGIKLCHNYGKYEKESNYRKLMLQ
tara:strand:- start:806 stop:1297 length:492 start_codon:yes stop_codon:yes gene_type:complete